MPRGVHQQPISVRDICAGVFPDLSWEEARGKVRQWPERGGVLASAAWLVHWRCRLLARKQILRLTDRLTTDTFSARPEVAPCPAR